MNRKTNRSTQRAPTVQPTANIAPSATLALDGDVPLSALHGVSAPEPLAAHDVLQAALAPRDDADAATTTPAADAPAPDGVAAEPVVEAADSAKKPVKKPAKSASKDVAADPVDVPAKAAKVAKDKFVKVAFSLPESEAGLLDALKKTHQGNGVAIKKSQLLRAGLLALADLDSDHIAKLLAHLPAEATARKKKK
jgi:hypothetical protein